MVTILDSYFTLNSVLQAYLTHKVGALVALSRDVQTS